MNNIKIILIALLAALSMGAQAQRDDAPERNPRGLYLGVQANSPLMWGDLFSLGKETRLGYGGGAFVGYTLGGWFSPELSFDYGIGRLGAKEYQLNDYVNKAGIITYMQYAPTDMKLGDLYSKTAYMQAGLRLQMGIVSLMRGGRYTPFDVELAPAVYMQKFSPVLYAAADNKKLDGYGIGKSDWNYTVGGDLSLRYRFSPKVSAHLRGGLLWLRNESFEGVNNDPLWRVNLMANASVGVTIHLGKSGQAISKSLDTPAPMPPQPKPEPVVETEPEPKVTIEVAPVPEPAREVVTADIPALFFRRGYADINLKLYQSNLDEMVRTLNRYADTDIAIEGWCDTTGTEGINARLSQQRAEALRDYLVNHGIDAARIKSVEGMGVDQAGGREQIARRAQVKWVNE